MSGLPRAASGDEAIGCRRPLTGPPRLWDTQFQAELYSVLNRSAQEPRKAPISGAPGRFSRLSAPEYLAGSRAGPIKRPKGTGPRRLSPSPDEAPQWVEGQMRKLDLGKPDPPPGAIGWTRRPFRAF